MSLLYCRRSLPNIDSTHILVHKCRNKWACSGTNSLHRGQTSTWSPTRQLQSLRAQAQLRVSSLNDAVLWWSATNGSAEHLKRPLKSEQAHKLCDTQQLDLTTHNFHLSHWMHGAVCVCGWACVCVSVRVCVWMRVGDMKGNRTRQTGGA